MSLVLDTGSSKAVLQELLELLSPAMATLIDNKLLSSLGPEYQFQAEALFDKAVNVLQARYDGHFTLEVLKPVQPFLVCALSHPKSKISTKGRGMWEITWGKKLAGKTIPSEIAACLKNSSFTDIVSYHPLRFSVFFIRLSELASVFFCLRKFLKISILLII